MIAVTAATPLQRRTETTLSPRAPTTVPIDARRNGPASHESALSSIDQSTSHDASVQPLFDGAAYVAAKAGVAILPVGVGGSERAMPKNAKWVRPRRVHVIIGELIPPAVPEGGRPSRAAVKASSERLHAELQRLFDLAQARAG